MGMRTSNDHCLLKTRTIVSDVTYIYNRSLVLVVGINRKIADNKISAIRPQNLNKRKKSESNNAFQTL